VELRKTGFLNPLEPNHTFESLDNNKLSEALKSFSSTAKALRINFIKGKLGLPELHTSYQLLLKKKKSSHQTSYLKIRKISHMLEKIITVLIKYFLMMNGTLC